MPKSPKKATKSATRKTPLKAVKAKPKAKLKAKATAAPTRASKATPAKPAPEAGRGFMWKILEQKRLQQKQKQENPHLGINPDDRASAPADAQGFGRFHGPRRRVG